MTTVRRVLLQLCLCLGLMPAAWGQDAKMRVVLPRPAAGETVTIAVKPDTILELAFSPAEIQVEVTENDLLLRFYEGGVLVLQGIVNETLRRSVVFDLGSAQVSAETVVSQAISLQAQPDVPLDDVASQQPPGDYDPNLSQLQYSGRDVLFPGEMERPGHPLYSYLLFAGASDGGREERERFGAAIKAYVGQFRSADALESSGAARREINIFYAPMKSIFEDTTPQNMRTHFGQRSPEEQVTLLLNLYDYARAEVLIGRMRFSGDGPYIVSVLRPLSQEAVAADEAFLVQDLSSVPPELVALWVDEFKRQVLNEAARSPEHLRRFALHLRTRIAVLAEAFAITKSAVAEMFQHPADGAGN